MLPARNEGPTVGAIVAAIVALDPLVDEVVVVDDGSTDATAAEASGAGATVVAAGPSGPGKGHAMWRGLAHTGGDIVVFCDADLEAFDAGFVTGLVAPLLNDERLCFVKAAYRRSLAGRDGEGGRVNELVARPLLALLFPELAW
ncbi:MAG: glycosyltransferase, partial [Acidimicrobiales bacterium]